MSAQAQRSVSVSVTLRALIAFKHALISHDVAKMAAYIDAIPLNVMGIPELESLFPIICASKSANKAELLEKVLMRLCAMPNWDNLELKFNGDCYWFKFDSKCVEIALDVLGKHSIQLGARLSALRRLDPAHPVYEDCLIRYRRVLTETSKFKGRTAVYDLREVANAWDYMTMNLSGACLFYGKMNEKQARALVDDFVTIDDFSRRNFGLDHCPIQLAASEMNGLILLRAMQFMHASGVNDAKYVTAFAAALRTFVAAQRYELQFYGHDSPQQYKAATIQDMLDYLQGFWFSTFETTLYSTLRDAVAEQLPQEPLLLKEVNVAKHKITTGIAKGKDNDPEACKPLWFAYRPAAVIPG